jgi:hypothetical protein
MTDQNADERDVDDQQTRDQNVDDQHTDATRPPAGWPRADLDPVRRLRVLAAALPGAMLGERVIAASPDVVWAVASDLENELPRLVHDIRSARVTVRDGDHGGHVDRVRDGDHVRHVELRAVGRLGQRARFDVDLRPGWCWMQSRFLLGGMAAAPHPDGTLFAFVGGVRLPGIVAARPILHRFERPLMSGLLRRLEDDVRAAVRP